MSGKPNQPADPATSEAEAPFITATDPARPVSLPEPDRIADAPKADALDVPGETSGPPAETVKSPAPVPQRRGVALPLLGGVLAAGLGFGLAQIVPDGWPREAQSERIASLEARLSDQARAVNALAQAGEVSDLAARITAFEQRLDALPDMGAELERLRSELTNAAPAADPAALTALRAELDDLRAELAARPDSGGLAEELAALKAEAEAERAATAARAEALRAEAEATARSARSQGAVLRLQAALDSGGPLAPALADLAGAGVTVPAELAALAEGVPTLLALQTGFPDAARAALTASAETAAPETMAGRLGAFVKAQTGMRSLTPREGDDPDAILSRAEAALATGDLTTVLAELDALPAEAATALAEWRTLTETRHRASTAVATLAGSLNN